MPSAISEINNLTSFRQGSLSTGNYRIRGTYPLPSFYVTPASNVVWSDNGAGGTFATSGANNENAVYTPKNAAQSVTISATDSGGTVTRPLTVESTLPVQPTVGFEVTFDIETKVKSARNPDIKYYREDGSVEAGWMLGWQEREVDQKIELIQFWLDHRKIKSFWLVDSEGNLMNKVKFVSEMKAVFEQQGKWNMSAGMKGVFQNIQATSEPKQELKINCGEAGAVPYITDTMYLNGEGFPQPDAIIDNSGVFEPAPDWVYKSVRYDAEYVEYLITGLYANRPYDVRLHFCMNTTRTLQPVLQGISKSQIVVAPDFVARADAYAGILADASGQISIRVNRVEGTNAIINGIEVTET